MTTAGTVTAGTVTAGVATEATLAEGTLTEGILTEETLTDTTASTSASPRVSPEKAEFAFIVASYNGARYLSRCARSIREKVGEGRYVLVVMDDASTDADVGEALERLRRREDTVVRVNPRNQGFSRNMNGGISLVLQGFPQVKYLVLLNQDTQLLTDITADALRALGERGGICGPRLLNADGSVQNSFYEFPTPGKRLAQLAGLRRAGNLARRLLSAGLVKAPRRTKHSASPCLMRLLSAGLVKAPLPPFARTYLKNFLPPGDVLEVPWLCGACLVVSREVFTDVGLLDEGFQMYGEDMDLCRRAGAAGWRILHFPEGRVVHHGNVDHLRLSRQSLSTYHASMERFYEKHFTGWRRRLLLLLNRAEEWKILARQGRR